MTSKNNTAVTYLLRNVPVGTYRKAQRLARQRGITLRTQILLLLEDFVNETENSK